MQKALVIGASGYLGGLTARKLIDGGSGVRCLARNPTKIEDLVAIGCEVVKGDISDQASLKLAVGGVQTVYVAIHMLSPQPGSDGKQRFMSVEMDGMKNIVAACKAHGVQRLIYVTSLGVAPNAASEWLRERWHIEEYLLKSGLNVTIIRPGMIVGAGGRGFDTLVGQAKKSIAVALELDGQGMRTIAVEDLIFYITAVQDDPGTFNQVYDVGNDDVLTNRQMLDIAADIVGRKPPTKIKIPRGLLTIAAPLIDRLGKTPQGAFRGFLDSLDADMAGNVAPIRKVLPHKLLTYREAVQKAWGIN